MIDKKKLHFLRLSSVFIAITIITLLYNWGHSPKMQPTASMMGQSMGNMMASMHLKNSKISDLFTIKKQKKSAMSEHHQAKKSYIRNIHYATTIIILVFIPFIVAGTAFLAIIWIK